MPPTVASDQPPPPTVTPASSADDPVSDRIGTRLDELRAIAAGMAHDRIDRAARDKLSALAEGLDRLGAEVAQSRDEADARMTYALEDLAAAQRRVKVGTWDFDLQSKHGSWSAYMFELFERDPRLGEPPYAEFVDLIHPADRPSLAEEQQRAVAGAPARAFELRTNPERITPRTLSCLIEAVVRADDGHTVLRGTNLDVTEHRRVSQALREANERLTQLLDSAPYTVLTLRPDTEISYVNRLPPGWPPEVCGTAFPSLIRPSGRTELQALVTKLFTHGAPFTIEVQDRGGAWLETRATPLRSEGEATGALVFLVDVTQRRDAAEARERLGQQMLHAQKLESLGVLAGGIAHDFNNLLAGVLANAELLRPFVPSGSAGIEHVEAIATASRRASDLAGQMLAYAGRGRFVTEAIDVRAVAGGMAGLLEVSKSKSVELRYEFVDDVPEFEGDVTQIRQVVMNLITNAADSIVGAGEIVVAAGAMECDADYLAESYVDDGLPPGRFVWVEVRDTGCGMDEATRDRMFEPFYTTKSMGRGLGLAAVLGIVRRHGGAIRVVSNPKGGTVVRCLFPAAGGVAADRPPSPPRPSPRARSGLILVVDDEHLLSSVLSSLLRRAGFEVIVGKDGAEGVALFREHHRQIAAVLLDVTMPGMDGKTALRRMLSIDPEVTAVLMSGYNEEVVARDVGMGLAGFVKKPFLPEELLEVLDTAIAGA